jgi:CubicO group peptidase (beta-lactamase class C family)
MTRSLPRSTPSAHGVDAAGVTAFIRALESTPQVEPHSIMLLRGGAVIAEGWWSPYEEGRPHLLYSLSKSFTSTAVGLAAAEGLLDLDDTVLSHFPELDAEITDPRSRSIRIRHVLSMASGHREETLDRAAALDPVDLVRGFLLVPPDQDPGTVFAYNQPCTFAAAAIVQRAAGVSLTEYLRPRLLDPLGIGPVSWLRDPLGREFGFSGLHADTEAIAALGQLYLSEGGELLSPEWVADATSKHIDNGTDPDSDWEQGYGFQFWLARHGYRGDGAYGQFCVVLPEHDVVLALTGQSTDMQAVLNLAWTHLLPAFAGPGSTQADAELAAALGTLGLAPVPDSEPRGALPATLRASAGNAHPPLTAISVEGDALILHDGEDRLELLPGYGEWITTGALSVSAGWSAGRLHVDVIFVETPHRMHLVLDPAAAAFTARWATVPLHPVPLSELRAP